jgi:hypothetical protein
MVGLPGVLLGLRIPCRVGGTPRSRFYAVRASHAALATPSSDAVQPAVLEPRVAAREPALRESTRGRCVTRALALLLTSLSQPHDREHAEQRSHDRQHAERHRWSRRRCGGGSRRERRTDRVTVFVA